MIRECSQDLATVLERRESGVLFIERCEPGAAGRGSPPGAKLGALHFGIHWLDEEGETDQSVDDVATLPRAEVLGCSLIYLPQDLTCDVICDDRVPPHLRH